jgi:hypothetical protein
MQWSIVSALAALVYATTAAARIDFRRVGRLVPPIEEADAGLITVISQSDATGSGFFEQILDHKNPNNGTFKQKFWWNIEFWAGPGSPVRLLVV